MCRPVPQALQAQRYDLEQFLGQTRRREEATASRLEQALAEAARWGGAGVGLGCEMEA